MSASPFPINRVRADTPGVETVLHFNNAGSSLPPTVVVDTVVKHLQREASIGGYEAAAEATEALDAVYASIAGLIGAQPYQIAVIENATRAWDMAVYGFPFRPGDRVITARAEYVSNVIALLQLQKRHGIEIVLIDNDETGQIDLAKLDRELSKGAAMMALTHVPTSGGLINPAKEVGQLCARHDVFYVLDGCQSAGHVPIDVGALGCDVFSTTGRKYLRGPRGTGFLYVGDKALNVLEPPFLDLHAATWTSDTDYEIRADARRFENWETYVAGKLGLGAAIDYARHLSVEVTSARVIDLAETLRDRLAELAGVAVHDLGQQRGGIVTFTVAGHPAEEIKLALSDASINTTVSTPSHARFDLAHRNLDGVVRASVHYYNTEDEIDRFLEVLDGMAGGAVGRQRAM